MQVTYIYNLFFYKLGGVCVKLNTQIFKLVLIFQARIKKRLMRLMAHGETVFGEQNRAHSRGGTDRAGSGPKAMRVRSGRDVDGGAKQYAQRRRNVTQNCTNGNGNERGNNVKEKKPRQQRERNETTRTKQRQQP